MIKTLTSLCLTLLLFAGAALAASIDGKWVSERKMERDGQSFTITSKMNLKSDGAKLTGTVATSFGEQDGPVAEITNGKVDGNKFSFSTTMSTPNGDFKMNWTGTVEGDTMKGTSEREGGQSRPFEAKRQ